LRAFCPNTYYRRMKFKDADRIVSKVPGPHIPGARAQILYDHLREHQPQDVLELGTARGGSAVYIAAALEANGRGHLTTVDSTRWKWRDPAPQEVLERAGLSHRVTFDKQSSTYAWFLKGELEGAMDDTGSVRPKYDFIFLDGAKNWSTDGITVVVAEKLLRPGGWLLLDDLGWNYAEHTNGGRHYEIDIGKLSVSEQSEPHLRAIFDLLIRPNPAFDQFLIEDDWWGWAHKAASATSPGHPAAGITVAPLRSGRTIGAALRHSRAFVGRALRH
jgi:predicted O-methyltransferase YrrM